MVATYLREVPALVEDGVVRTAATILASHAQHLALVRARDVDARPSGANREAR